LEGKFIQNQVANQENMSAYNPWICNLFCGST